MISPTDEKPKPAPVIGKPSTPSSLQPTGSVEPDKGPEIHHSLIKSPDERDAWEKLPLTQKIAAVGFLVFAWGVFLAIIGAIDKPEVIASSILGIAIALISLNQYYVSKRQWFAMRQGLEKTQGQLEIMDDQADLMHQQLEVMRETLEQSENHFKAINRPIVSIQEIKWDSERPRAGMNAGKFWRVRVEMRNFGNTIAHVTLRDATLRVVPDIGLSDQCPLPQTSPFRRGSNMVVASQGTFSINVEIPFLSNEDYFNLWTDDLDRFDQWKRVVLWIDLTYRDGFGKDYIFRHHARFNRVNFVPCNEHSEAD